LGAIGGAYALGFGLIDKVIQSPLIKRLRKC
jgi:hypothetical protein